MPRNTDEDAGAAILTPRRAQLALLGYAGVLLALAVLGVDWEAWVRPIGLGDVRDLRYVVAWLGETAGAAFINAGRYVPIGLLARWAVGGEPGNRRRRVPGGAASVATAMALTVFVRASEVGAPWAWPGSLALLAPGLGAVAGVGVGLRWGHPAMRSANTPPTEPIRRLALYLSVAVLCLTALGAAATTLVWLAVERRPSPIEVVRVSVEDKRQLRTLFSGANPKGLRNGETHTIRLTERHINQLLSWGLTLDGHPGRRVRVELEEGRARIHATTPLPRVAGISGFLNVSATAAVALDAGQVRLHADALRVGRLPVPRVVLSVLSFLTTQVAKTDRRARTLLEPVERVEIRNGTLEVAYGRVELPPGFIAELFRSERAATHLIPPVRAQLDHLVAQAPKLPRGEARFGAALETAFGLASERSAPGGLGSGDPVLENKAAILALGILGGHWRIEQTIGGILDDSTRVAGLRGFSTMRLRKRPDWTRHFLVSAALVVLAEERISLAAGLLKEELDAQGSSGFSFGDLLADRAGTMFATVSIRDRASAVAMQDRLKRGFRVDDVFPPAHDLPEGLSDRELESDYGGIDGDRFRAVLNEIDRRVAACAAYRQ